MAEILVSAKVSVFYSMINKTFPKSSQRFYLAQTLIKSIKTQSYQRLHELFMTKQEQKTLSWVASQQALSFNAAS